MKNASIIKLCLLGWGKIPELKKQGGYTREDYAIMLNHKQRQRENRKAKRRLKHQLKAFSEINKSDVPISIYKEQLDKSFLDYAISETRKELHSGNIELDRKVVLKKVILLKDKLNPRKEIKIK